MDEVSTETFKPPYLSFQTFWTFMAELASKPLPPQIDRSIMPSKSGTDQNHLVAALVAFHCIEEDGTVMAPLVRFAAAPAERRNEKLESLVRRFYPLPLAVSEQNGTSAKLNEVFRDQLGMTSADTRRKAITFFLHAARQAGLQLSPHFPTTRSGSGAPGTPKMRTKRPGTGTRRRSSTPPPAPASAPVISAKEQKVISLGSAGTVTLSVDVRWLDLHVEKFTRLRQVIDELEALGEGTGDSDDPGTTGERVL